MLDLQWLTHNSALGTFSAGSAISSIQISAGYSSYYTVIAGSLPKGLSMSTSGLITGTPAVVLNTTTSKFVVRARSSISGKVADKTFNITITNVVPPVWTTPAGFIAVNTTTNVNGTAINNEELSIRLTATSPLNLPIVYNVSAGSTLPHGLNLLSTSGYIAGIVSEKIYPGTVQRYNFSIDAVSGTARSTQTFNITVINPFTLTADDTIIGFSSTSSNIYIGSFSGVHASTGTYTSISAIQAPEFLRDSNLGEITSNSKYYIPVTAYDPDPLLGPIVYSSIYSIGDGDFKRIPNGLTLDPNAGYLYGYITTQTNFKQVYEFVIKATKYDKISGASISTTNTFTISTMAEYYDTITWETTSTLTSLLEGRISQLSVVASHIDTEWPLLYRYFGGDLLPNGLSLTIGGDIIGSTTASGTYTFAVLACTSTYLYNNIILDGGWGYTTGTQLFSSNDFVLDAGGSNAVYDESTTAFVIDGGGSTNSYDYNIDAGTTATIYDVNSYDLDGGGASALFTITNLNVDGGSIASVYGGYDLVPGLALSLTNEDDPNLLGPVYPYPFSIKEFTLTVLPSVYEYTDIYVRPFLNPSTRTLFSNFINDTSIFVPSMFYRADDPNFGLRTDIKMYLEFGIQELNLSQYVPAVLQNFYNKAVYFGTPNVAVAKDSTGKVVYEMVYVPMVDPSNGVKATVHMNHNSTYYPASVDNMRLELSLIAVDGHYVSISTTYLPGYMTTYQNDMQPPGYKMVVPLCYATPGNGVRILNNILHSSFDFKMLNFEFDRFVVANSLDNSGAKYIKFPRHTITDQIYSDNYLFGGDGIEWVFDDNNPLQNNI